MDQESQTYDSSGKVPSRVEPAPLGEVLITRQLSDRPSRAPDYETENLALHTLSRALADHPGDLFQKLVETIVDVIPAADSAGISNYLPGEDGGVFRWDAVAGLFAENVGGSMPYDLSPCGTVVDRNTALLFDRPERCFPALADARPPIRENLLVPFHINGEPVGTVWAINHSPEGRFEAEDERLLTSLSQFASAGYHFARGARYRDELQERVRTRTAELEQAEVEAHRSRRRLQAIFDHSLDAILLADDEGGYVDANNAASELLGYPIEELCELSVWDVTPGQDQDEGRRFWRRFLREGSLKGEYSVVRKDGRRVEAEFRATAHIVPGVHLSIMRDITERKQSEEALRESKERLAADLAGMRRLYDLHAKLANESDLQTALDEILAAAVELANTDRGTIQLLREERGNLEIVAAEGYGLSSRFVEHFRHDGLKQVCDAAKRDQKRIITEDFRALPGVEETEEGKVILDEGIFAGQSTPIQTREGELVGVLSTQYRQPYHPTDHELKMLDLLAWTAAGFIERTRREEELRELNETLEQRVRQRTETIRELASKLTMAEQEERRRISQILHDDLQQLLYGIQLKMMFVRRGAQQHEKDGFLSHVEDATERLDDAIRTTRQLTVDLSPPVLQGEGLTETLKWLQSQMCELHDLTVDVQADRPFRIPNEDMRVLLFQIVRELLFNVVKHADTDHATVRLCEKNEELVIYVADDGRGFDVAAVDVEQSNNGGFGLFSVRERLDLFGGSMSIDSQVGEGTRVTIYTNVASG